MNTSNQFHSLAKDMHVAKIWIWVLVANARDGVYGQLQIVNGLLVPLDLIESNLYLACIVSECRHLFSSAT